MISRGLLPCWVLTCVDRELHCVLFFIVFLCDIAGARQEEEVCGFLFLVIFQQLGAEFYQTLTVK